MVPGYAVPMTDGTDDGQVSEVSGLGTEKPGTPISDGDHVAGSPTGESGSPDEGEETGPDARSGSEDEDDWY